MSIHHITASSEICAALSSMDCWNISTADIGKLAALVIGNAHMPQLRHGAMSAIIVGTTYGGAAKRFSDEFRSLAKQCAAIRAETDHSELQAIAFFHLRFGGVHPLVDSNGRVSRLLLSEQIRRKFAVETQSTLDFLLASNAEYRAVFAPLAPQEKFKRMCDLSARLAGAECHAVRKLSFPIAPVYPDKRPPLDSMHHDHAGQKNGVDNHRYGQRAITIEFQQTLNKTP